MARRRKVAPAGADAPPPRAAEEIRRENWARARDSLCAWYCAGDRLREFVCNAAGVPAAAHKFTAEELSDRERRSIVNALAVPEVRKEVPDAIYWGLVQLEPIQA